MKYQTYLIDLDGTMYRGKEKIPEARVFIDNLNRAGVDYYFLTNNTTKTPQQVADNLVNNHQITATPEQVVTTTIAKTTYIQNMFYNDNTKHSAYVISEYG